MKRMIIYLLLFCANLAKASEQEASASKISPENQQREYLSDDSDCDENERDELERELESIPVVPEGEEYLFMIMNKKMPPPHL